MEYTIVRINLDVSVIITFALRICIGKMNEGVDIMAKSLQFVLVMVGKPGVMLSKTDLH